MASELKVARSDNKNMHSRLSCIGSSVVLIIFTAVYFFVDLMVVIFSLLFTGTVDGQFLLLQISYIGVALVVSIGLWRGRKWAFLVGGIIAIITSYKIFYPIGTIAGLLLIIFIYWTDKLEEERIVRYFFTIAFLVSALISVIVNTNYQSLPNFNPQDKRLTGIYDPEVKYWITARDLQYPEVCYLISPETFVEDSYAPIDEQIYFLRSRCIFDLAILTKNISLCSYVISAGKWKFHGTFLNGNGISPEQCQEIIESKGVSYTPDSFSVFNMGEEFEYYEMLLKRLEYTEHDVSDFFGYNEVGLTQWREFYELIKNTPEFKEKLGKIK
jgi:hypothetical protein